MVTCERCGAVAPPGARYCPACGHHLGQSPEQPVVIQVPPQPEGACSGVRGVWHGCLGCFAWVVVVVLVLLLLSWVLSC